MNDRLDRIEHLISIRNVHADDHELFELILEELKMLRQRTDAWERFAGSQILEELKMLRQRTDAWERFIGSLRKEFQ